MKNDFQNKNTVLQKKIEYQFEKKYVKRLELLERNIKKLQKYRDKLKEKNDF